MCQQDLHLYRKAQEKQSNYMDCPPQSRPLSTAELSPQPNGQHMSLHAPQQDSLPSQEVAQQSRFPTSSRRPNLLLASSPFEWLGPSMEIPISLIVTPSSPLSRRSHPFRCSHHLPDHAASPRGPARSAIRQSPIYFPSFLTFFHLTLLLACSRGPRLGARMMCSHPLPLKFCCPPSCQWHSGHLCI